ncbi:unnamed protein product [Linum trigynum]|uniref:Uncharacterized protein n=1 Tax=Linum trigynum TaxID=586398 RepID=A0AAV2GB39_9ROSI
MTSETQPLSLEPSPSAKEFEFVPDSLPSPSPETHSPPLEPLPQTVRPFSLAPETQHSSRSESPNPHLPFSDPNPLAITVFQPLDAAYLKEWRKEQDLHHIIKAGKNLQPVLQLNAEVTPEEAFNQFEEVAYTSKGKKRREHRSKLQMEIHRLGVQVQPCVTPRRRKMDTRRRDRGDTNYATGCSDRSPSRSAVNSSHD